MASVLVYQKRCFHDHFSVEVFVILLKLIPCIKKIILLDVKIYLVEHFEVILGQGVGGFLGGDAEVFENNGDVHVDDDEEGHDEVGAEESDGHRVVPAVPIPARVPILLVRVAVGRLRIKHWRQQPIPS